MGMADGSDEGTPPSSLTQLELVQVLLGDIGCSLIHTHTRTRTRTHTHTHTHTHTPGSFVGSTGKNLSARP